MWPAMQHPSISALWADALFVSALQRSDDPSAGQVQHAIAAAIRDSAARAVPNGWRRSLATIPTPRSFECAGLARRPTRRLMVQHQSPVHARMPAHAERSAPVAPL